MCVTLSNVFGVLIPQTIREALDYVFYSIQDYKMMEGFEYQGSLLKDLRTNLLIFAVMVLGFSLLMGVFMYFMRQTIIVMSRHIEYDMRAEIFEHYTRMNLNFFKENKTGDLMARISEDVSKVRMYLGPALLYGINLVTLFTIVIYSMFSVSVSLSFYVLIPLPVLSISIYIVSNIINKKSAIIQKQLSVINSQAQEVYSGIRVIKAYVKEKQFNNYFVDESEDYKLKSLDLAKVNAMFFPLMILLISISTLLTLYFGGRQVGQGLISPGNIAEFIIYVGMLTWPITSLGWIASLIQQAEASQERINEFMSVEPQITYKKGKVPTNWNIEFKDVHFTYPETGIKALDGVSFTLNDGDKMAIVGKTASGKSTIAELLLRMYDINSGEILIGGIPINEIDLSFLRQNIAYVPQDVFLFSDTISSNIQFGMEEGAMELVEEYANYAAVHEDILDLPKAYETLVGERGVTLSGGQKQRISLARALILEPELIILDDSLSAVDANTEQKIVDFFNTSLKDKSSIIITHRIQTQMDYNKIVVLEDGKLSIEGTHEELMNKNEYYKELVLSNSVESQS